MDNISLSKDTSLNKNDYAVICSLHKIIEHGHNAEVKGNSDGTWTVYEVRKTKKVMSHG